ncbi:MAG: glycerophosphodiester phosphodiesterase [Ruminococcaceae bacterium]|nr:glycerophosphodiester phosphodiesterase [Oscillospiraceae bacterium]
MTAWLIAVVAFFATVLALFGLWLFLIAPKARKKEMQPFLRPYAHRGLWNSERPENSQAAFDAACKAGFAIELDVQLSADGEVMVFHDYTLDRVCGRSGRVAGLTAAELGKIPLNGVENECIPTFRQVLETVDGRVPLLIELKGESTNTALVPAVLKVLEGYEGLWCMESFNPMLLRAVRKQAPRAVIGLLSSDLIRQKRKGNKVLNFLLSALLLTFLCRPAFHAFDGHYPNRLGLRAGLKWFGAAAFVFTMQRQEDYDYFLAKGAYPIFDGFVPKNQ